ncbi:MAG TPA: hypothetical protein PL072_05430 [Phycisphaerales bacterium]|nr:hypothetical protein [Phycisphaerales bacterium]
MTEEQQKEALRLLAFFADGCRCGIRLRCFECRARDLLKANGYTQDRRGNWNLVKGHEGSHKSERGDERP